jgi:hypothetical protein
MHATVRRYKIAPTSVGKLTQEIREGFVPIVSNVPGFKEYFWVNADDGVMFSISVYENRAGAEESSRRAAGWVREHIASLLPGPPEITTGEVVVHQAGVAKGQAAGDC